MRTMFIFVGPAIRAHFEDLKPAALAQVDQEFDRVCFSLFVRFRISFRVSLSPLSMLFSSPT